MPQRAYPLNRDTLYSAAVFDLNAGPVTITLPDAGKRFMSMQVFDEDEYVVEVVYRAGRYSYSKEKVGTRYILVGCRTLVDPGSAEDIKQVHSLQDAIKVEQASTGKFEIPQWDQASQIRGA